MELVAAGQLAEHLASRKVLKAHRAAAGFGGGGVARGVGSNRQAVDCTDQRLVRGLPLLQAVLCGHPIRGYTPSEAMMVHLHHGPDLSPSPCPFRNDLTPQWWLSRLLPLEEHADRDDDDENNGEPEGKACGGGSGRGDAAAVAARC